MDDYDDSIDNELDAETDDLSNEANADVNTQNGGDELLYDNNSYNPYDNVNQSDVDSIRSRINKRSIVDGRPINTNVGENNNSLEKKEGLEKKDGLESSESAESKESKSNSQQQTTKEENKSVSEGVAADKLKILSFGSLDENDVANTAGQIVKKKVIVTVIPIVFYIILIILAISLVLGVITGIIAYVTGEENVGDSTTNYYSSIPGGRFLWPIGSKETTEKNGVVYAMGEPVSTTITSKYGVRKDPLNPSKTKKHNGIDIGVGKGNTAGDTNVIAARSGVVTKVVKNCISYDKEHTSCGGGYGNYILISHTDGKYTLYAHLHQNTITVQKNDIVMPGQVIAKAGSSGRSTGAHLHFEVRTNISNRVNPLDYVDPNNPRWKTSTSSK